MRPTANPAPKTESAKEALRAFYCDLCDRGYSRISEYEAHLSSYTHAHKKNFAELKASQRDSSSAAADERRERERIREEKELQRIMVASGNIATSSTSTPATTGMKPISISKPGFKKIESTTASGGGWKKVGGTTTTTTTTGELNWINDGQADYDPAYPTPV